MDVFADYLSQIDNPEHSARLAEILTWIQSTFPRLVPRIAWNQPMFTDHGTFIIGFSIAKNHIAFALEKAGMARFATEVDRAGYSRGKEFIQIRWEQEVDYVLLKQMIDFNIRDKADCQTFWRK